MHICFLFFILLPFPFLCLFVFIFFLFVFHIASTGQSFFPFFFIFLSFFIIFSSGIFSIAKFNPSKSPKFSFSSLSNNYVIEKSEIFLYNKKNNLQTYSSQVVIKWCLSCGYLRKNILPHLKSKVLFQLSTLK